MFKGGDGIIVVNKEIIVQVIYLNLVVVIFVYEEDGFICQVFFGVKVGEFFVVKFGNIIIGRNLDIVLLVLNNFVVFGVG